MKFAAMAGRRVAVLGLGREGLAFCRAFARQLPGQDLSAFAEQAPDHVPHNVRSEIGPFGGRLRQFDILVRSPGIPVSHPAIVAATGSGVRVVSPSSIWFAERPDVPTVAVTGSKGKSTTAAVLAHLVNAAGRRAGLGGNIGSPLLDHLDTDVQWMVAELSSYQLADLEGRPVMGILPRLFPEHQDWHGGVEAYFAAKLRILDLCDPGPVFINGRDPVLMARCAARPKVVAGNLESGLHGSVRGIMDGGVELIGARQLPLRGSHNFGNIALALTAGLEMGLAMDEMLAALPGFRPLEHRLESVATGDGLEWINDSISTSPQATLAALECLDNRPVVLIAGGQERGGDWAPVFAGAGAGLHGLITLPDNGERIAGEARTSLNPAGGIHECADLEQAVALARQMAPAGGVVLLSPGAPSYPRFRDFRARGRSFARLALSSDG